MADKPKATVWMYVGIIVLVWPVAFLLPLPGAPAGALGGTIWAIWKIVQINRANAKAKALPPTV